MKWNESGIFWLFYSMNVFANCIVGFRVDRFFLSDQLVSYLLMARDTIEKLKENTSAKQFKH